MNDLQHTLRASFIEDARENLDGAESLLLKVGARASPDDIATLFRAVHNVKGGAGSFGFPELSKAAHGLETCLDQLRSGQRAWSPAVVQVLLSGVDVLRFMLLNPERDATAQRSSLQRGLDSLNGPAAPDWVIDFAPPDALLTIGPDPLKLFDALAALGPLSIEVNAAEVPPLPTFDPGRCYCRFTLRLPGTVERQAIENVFDWVDGGWSVRADAPAQQAAQDPASAVEPSASPIASASVRVPVEKLDQLMNMVGELVITQSMLGEVDPSVPLSGARLGRLSEGLVQLARNTRMLQESVMRLRSQPLSVVFGRFPRLVHDLAEQLGKRVSLEISGESTELDKTVIEKLGDPLTHLVRNCLDHGLETPAERVAAGKPETGSLTVRAFSRGKDIYLEVADDGRGLDEDRILEKARALGLVSGDERPPSDRIVEFIFSSGLSTAREVTNVSGRGVGMDAVRQHIQALGGDIVVRSTPGRGTAFTLRLPLSLAIMDGQLVRVGERHYVIPLLSIVESIQPDRAQLTTFGQQPAYVVRGELIPLIDLRERLRCAPAADSLMVVVETERGRVGLLVDELLSQQQVVVKSLETNYGQVPGFAGATILGDGSVSLILEPNSLAAA